jgi:UDP-N-acetylglucosamine 2-epimerase (non-hydrolysing)
MKIAPFAAAIERHNAGAGPRIEHRLVHTGQHYDAAMSDAFFRDLGIPKPDVDLGIGSGTHAEQVGRTMIAFEPVVAEWRPDWIVVVGDVNATCAAGLVAAKQHVRLAHIEAGLRSFDRRMPEEINRLVTDTLADLLFTTDALADENLRREGVAPEKIRRVGNIMIDSLEKHRPRAAALALDDILARYRIATPAGADIHLRDGEYAALTLHRPSNVDDPEILGRLTAYLCDELAAHMPLVWTLHPRTRKHLQQFGLWDRVARCRGVIAAEPVGYFEMLRLNMGARIVLTDSGGLQEECCVLGTPCVTLRENTERPVTLREHGGVSELAGNDVGRIRAAVESLLRMPRRPHAPLMWDGHTAERIVAELVASGR